MRADKRANGELRPFSIERNVQPNAYASLLIKMGNTHVICAVSMEEKVPPFLTGKECGWITAEYGILPGATDSRYRREVGGRTGRTYEIQRLIGRSLRMMIDLKLLGEYTLRVDCDVLTADGGTRTASITGAAIALADAVKKMQQEGLVAGEVEITPIASVSAGMVNGEVLLDLNYPEDSSAEADGNFVMTANGEWVEAQLTAEGKPVSQENFLELTTIARQGIEQLFTLWE